MLWTLAQAEFDGTVWSLEQLALAYRRQRQGKPTSATAREQMDLYFNRGKLSEERRAERIAFLETQDFREEDRQRRVRDLRRYGQLAREFYADPAHGGHNVDRDAARLGVLIPARGTTRAPRAAAARRRGSRRTASPSDDPDLPDLEPERPVSLLAPYSSPFGRVNRAMRDFLRGVA
ncbi:MAG: hypothetical protein ACR2OC_11210 [Solirubrobacterales bacterium]